MWCLTLQLSAATEAYESCEKRTTSLNTEIYNKDAQIQQLEAQNNLLIQQQANKKPLRNGMQPSPGQGFKDLNIKDSQKQKTLSELKEKLDNGIVLSKQEQSVLNMLTRETVVDSQIPTKRKISVPLTRDNGGKREGGIQQPPPPQPGNSPQLNRADEEQVEDLVDGKNKKDTLENLDTKEDFEGGADGGDDGGDQHEGRDYMPHDEQENYDEQARQEDEQGFGDRDGEEKEEGKPLPNPVGEKDDVVDFPDKGNPDDDVDDDVSTFISMLLV